MIGVKDKAELHGMANACVGGLWRPRRESSAFIDGGSSRSHARQRRLGTRCLIVPRLWADPGSLLHLSRQAQRDLYN